MENRFDDLLLGRGGQKEIDESRPGDIRFLQIGRGRQIADQIFCHLAWIALQTLRQLHGDVRRVVAMLCLLGAFQRDRCVLLVRRDHRYGLLDQLGERAL